MRYGGWCLTIEYTTDDVKRSARLRFLELRALAEALSMTWAHSCVQCSRTSSDTWRETFLARASFRWGRRLVPGAILDQVRAGQQQTRPFPAVQILCFSFQQWKGRSAQKLCSFIRCRPPNCGFFCCLESLLCWAQISRGQS